MGGVNSVGKIPAGPDAAADGCHVAGDCAAGWDPAALLVVLFWAGVFCVLVFGSLSYVPGARSLLKDEREKTSRERDAFEAFADRVGRLPVSTPTAVAAGPQTLVGAADGPDDRLQEVQDAYRDTVIGMAHYDEEYGEPLATNMAAEFSEELAGAVADGTAFTPQVQQALVAGASEARSERDAFLRTLAAEGEEVRDAESTLSRVDRKCEEIRDRRLELASYAELDEAWTKLDEMEAACEACLADRQTSIHDGYTLGFRSGDSETFHSYLYRSLDVSYPVLADGADVLESLRETRRGVTAAASSRV